MASLRARIIWNAAAAALIVLTISGCQHHRIAVNKNGQTTEQRRASAPADEPLRITERPPMALDSDNAAESPVLHTSAPESKSSVEGAKLNASDAGPHETAAAAASRRKEAKWDPKSPKLHGIAIGESKQAAEKRLGQPASSYTLEEEDGKINISEYDGFSVGYDNGRKVLFVEVYDKKVAAELNGVRIGDDANGVVKALGKPGKRSDSLLSYDVSGALLRLDLDPDTGKVISIKLFAK